MAITVDATRPKADVVNALALAIALGTVVENDGTGDTKEGFFVPVNATNLNVPPFDVTNCTTTNGSDVITTNESGFSLVKVGDGVAGTGIAASTFVLAKNDDNTLQLSNAATTDGTETLTFTPSGGSTIDLTLFGIEMIIMRQNNNLIITFTAHEYDGNLGGTEGTETNSTSQKNLNQIVINLDEMMTNARIPRSN